MSQRITGGGCNFDLNVLVMAAEIGVPFQTKAQLIIDQFGGDPGEATVLQMELYPSVKRKGEMNPNDTNVLYMGDTGKYGIRTNTPWPIVSNRPKGRREDGTWETERIVFRPAIIGAKVPLHPNPNRQGAFQCLYAFTFWSICLGLSQPKPYPGDVGLITLPETKINQTTIMRALGTDGQYEFASMHGTQTDIRVPT